MDIGVFGCWGVVADGLCLGLPKDKRSETTEQGSVEEMH